MSMDFIGLSVGMGYTDETVIGGGALKGKNCVISNIEEVADGINVTFQWTLDNGTVQIETVLLPKGTQGEDGVDGKSAYEIWLEAGNTGTEEDFLISLVGEKGADGKSAYQYAQDGGYIGTETEFTTNIARSGVISKELEVERARIDNLTTLQDGSTTGDGELIDGRIDYTGFNHKNIGTHIRKVSNELFNEIVGVMETVGKPTLLWEQGGINTTTGQNTPDDYKSRDLFVRTSNFIKVGKGLNIVFPITDTITVFTYDENKNYVSMEGYVGNITISPNEAFYIRLRMFHRNSTQITPEYASENVSVAYEGTTSMTGKIVCVYGDSITKNPVWSNIINKELCLGKVYNLGWSDSAVTMENKTLYINADGTYNSNPISTEQPEGTTEVQCSFCHDDRIAYIPTDTEIVLVMGGTNDLYRSRPLGNITTDGVYDESTFIGALISTVQKIQTRLPNATIVLMTPITKPSADGAIVPFINNNNNTIVDYVNAVRNVADYIGCNLIDVHNCGITLFNASAKLSDGTHPNSDGANLIAQTVIGGLKQIFTI